MPKKFFSHKKGISVVEILISLAMIGVIAISIGTALASNNRLAKVSLNQEKALGFAKQTLEILSVHANDFFACRCSVDNCTANQCTHTNDGQTCIKFEGYQSCWMVLPKNLAQNSNLHLKNNAGIWQLALGAEAISEAPGFSRYITFQNLSRDADGNLVDVGGTLDPNSKRVIITISWQESGQNKNLDLQTELTGWKNLNP
ncbi:MAG: hypothetical protein WCT08_04025 [Patescibacteria group bacterium]|jgi:Tfp pilus assembly protein PilV